MNEIKYIKPKSEKGSICSLQHAISYAIAAMVWSTDGPFYLQLIRPDHRRYHSVIKTQERDEF